MESTNFLCGLKCSHCPHHCSLTHPACAEGVLEAESVIMQAATSRCIMESDPYRPEHTYDNAYEAELAASRVWARGITTPEVTSPAVYHSDGTRLLSWTASDHRGWENSKRHVGARTGHRMGRRRAF